LLWLILFVPLSLNAAAALFLISYVMAYSKRRLSNSHTLYAKAVYSNKVQDAVFDAIVDGYDEIKIVRDQERPYLFNVYVKGYKHSF